MARVLPVLEEYACNVVGRMGGHPLCGPATLSVGTIEGGVSVNTVPDLCTIEIDRRVSPEEDHHQARLDAIDYLRSALGSDFPVDHDPPEFSGPALPDTNNGPLAERLIAVTRDVHGTCQRRGVPYGTHAAVYAAAGVPSVVFGPGFIEQAHTRDEWVPIDQVRAAAEVYYRFCHAGCRA
jgi:acetylornithine deacetylase